MPSSLSAIALDVLALRGLSVCPTFSADLRKSLLAHFELLELADDVDVDVGAEITLVGDSNFGAWGGNVLLLYTFCLDGDEDVLFGASVGGLFDLDFSLFDTLFIELLREMDGDFDIELSRDFDGLFSGDFSIDFSTFFSGELSFESRSALVEW